MSKSKTHAVAEGPTRLERSLREAVLLTSAAVTIYLLLALFSYDTTDPGWSSTGVGGSVSNLGGVVGAWVADVVLSLFGYVGFVLPWLIFAGGVIHYRSSTGGRRLVDSVTARIVASVFLLLGACGLAAAHDLGDPAALPQGSGGMLGAVMATELGKVLGTVGSTLMFLTILVAAAPLSLAFSWLAIMDAIGGGLLGLVQRLRSRMAERAARRAEDKKKTKPAVTAPKPPPVLPPAEPPKSKRKAKKKTAPAVEPANQLPLPMDADASGAAVPTFEGDPLPSSEMLDPPRASTHAYTTEELDQMSREVETRLAEFGVTVEVVAATPGPVITRFELEPAPGVKVSQVSNLSKDLARALSAVAVRVVEVIPGKSVIGLEIPNQHRELVALRGILENASYGRSESPLTMALGKDIGGQAVVANLGKMPHLLVAGTTGSGKSVAVNVMILSMLYKATARDVRLIMIDPKMLELSVYDGIPHLLAPVVTDMKEAANALRWCVAEMERRYKLMAAMGVRNIAGLNRKIADAEQAGEPIIDPLSDPEEEERPTLEHMPYIVVIVDELADMMMVVGKKVEELIARLAQKARASGIHLILATQRPSVDVITGLIKANIPTRIAFQVSSRIDSRTILDQQGAESLLGHGDMLYLPPGTGVPTRVHGAFVDDHEVHKVVAYLKQVGAPVFEDGILDGSAGDAALPGEAGAAGGDDESDPLYDDAVKIVTESRKASISWVQRRLKIGYNRAARIVEQMEASGVVGPVSGGGAREVIAPPPPEV
ncbi:MAG: DNA translocase FtsK 4TM domain-containing protein [Abyssibacter sp.]|nr:DNA translocase FtsK [Abyssibacter sp.]MCK5859853.1 DNA translocase FtsK 4TM domain-containing protein [Abyssibacter sp.]